MKRFFCIGAAMLFIDWLLGWGCAADILPSWLFFLANIPFGAAYVWMESHWTGANYEILIWGHRFSDLDSLALWAAVVFLQTGVYYFLLRWWSRWHGRPGHAHGRDAHATRG